MNEVTANSLKSPNNRNDIKHIIESALVKNKKLGFLQNNLLHIQIFGTNESLDRVFFIFGLLGLILCFFVQIDLYINGIIALIAICFIITGFIFKKLLKFYLVYDIDRKVFYTISKINDSIISKSKEILTNDFIELGVNQTFLKNDGRRPSDLAFFYRGNINDNPGIRTSFVALKRNGEIVNLTYPLGSKQAEARAVAACKLFSECLGLNSVICEKKDYLIVVNGQGQNYILAKASLAEELETRKSISNILVLAVFIGFVIFAFFIFSAF